MTATDRLTDFKLGTIVSVKAENDCRGVGQPQVAMYSQLSQFLVIIIIVNNIIITHHHYTPNVA